MKTPLTASIVILTVLLPLAVKGETELTASMSDPEPITLRVGESTELPRLLYAFNSQLAGSTMSPTGIGYDSIEFAGIVAKLNPGAVRFPGGTVGNHYLWRIDSFERSKEDLTKWAQKLLTEFRDGGYSYGLDAFIDLSERLGFEPIWMVNIFANSPEDVVDWVRYIRERGGSVRFIELGNESYWDPHSHNNVEAYVGFARPIAYAVRAEDPSIRIGVNLGPFGRRGNYEVIWNEPISRDQSWYDAVIHHEYPGGQGIAVDEDTSGTTFDVLFADREIRESLEKVHETHPDKPLWITEWNIGGALRHEYGQSMAHLLFQAATYAFMMETHDHYELGGLHQIEGGAWGTYTSGVHGEIQTGPSFDLWKMIGDATLRADAYIPIEIDGVETDAERLRQMALGFGNESGVESIFFINRDADAVGLDLRSVLGEEAETVGVRQIAGDPEHLGTPLPAGVDPTVNLEMPVGQVVLPPYSISLIQ